MSALASEDNCNGREGIDRSPEIFQRVDVVRLDKPESGEDRCNMRDGDGRRRECHIGHERGELGIEGFEGSISHIRYIVPVVIVATIDAELTMGIKQREVERGRLGRFGSPRATQSSGERHFPQKT